VTEENSTKFELVGSNPIKGLSFINYQMPQGITEGELLITNLQGKLVDQSEVKGNAGSILLNAQDYPSGIYQFTLLTSKGQETIRLVVE
jgi:hypothetical protein